MDRDLQSNSISLNDRVFLIPEPDKVMNHEYNECCEECAIVQIKNGNVDINIDTSKVVVPEFEYILKNYKPYRTESDHGGKYYNVIFPLKDIEKMNLINNFYTLEKEEIDYKDIVTGMNKVMISKNFF